MFRRSRAFEARRRVRGAGKGAVEFAFVHASGREVRTDELGKAIWESLPGEREEVARRAVARIDEERPRDEGRPRDAGEVRQTGMEGVIAEGGDAGGWEKAEGAEGAEKSRIAGLIDNFLTVLVRAGIVEADEAGVDDGAAVRVEGGEEGRILGQDVGFAKAEAGRRRADSSGGAAGAPQGGEKFPALDENAGSLLQK